MRKGDVQLEQREFRAPQFADVGQGPVIVPVRPWHGARQCGKAPEPANSFLTVGDRDQLYRGAQQLQPALAHTIGEVCRSQPIDHLGV